MAASLCEALVNHVVLPPRLPGRQSSRLDKIGQSLIDRMIDATREIARLPEIQSINTWECLRRSLQTCKTLNEGGKLNSSSLLAAFREMVGQDTLILHIAEQNAALLIRREQKAGQEHVIFEIFESSPLSEKVLAANALQWDFPGTAVAIPYETFNEPSFQDELASFLEQASSESIKRFAPRAFKSGSSTFESRNTVAPSLISQMLVTLLEVNGTECFPPILRKRVRDDVCWEDGGVKPWRRCPFWLVLRVGVQRYLSSSLGGESGRLHYKFLLCIFLSNLLDDTFETLAMDVIVLLKTKLCRRLVKLESDRDRAPVALQTMYKYMLDKLSPTFNQSLGHATGHLESIWEQFKTSNRRRIGKLPHNAALSDVTLSFDSSWRYLQRVLVRNKETKLNHKTASQHPPAHSDIISAVRKSSHDFAQRYFHLAKLELEVENVDEILFGIGGPYEFPADFLNIYLDVVSSNYERNPEQMGTMLLTVMDLWMRIDKFSIGQLPLLSEFIPPFPSEILDVLQLAQRKDMFRAHEIRSYLVKRHQNCGTNRMTIFHDPEVGCFAERYYNGSPTMQELHQDIEHRAEIARVKKEKEWNEKANEYEALFKAMSEMTCIYTLNKYQQRVHNQYQCPRCNLEYRARQITIQGYEHPLPNDLVQAKAVIFELECPNVFEAYRTTTWKIISTLALPTKVADLRTHWLLNEYSQLALRVSKSSRRIWEFTMASTKKSWLVTHYTSPLRFPLALEEVCHPNGFQFRYFDTALDIFPASQTRKPTFAHHFAMNIPSESPFACLQQLPEFAADGRGPTSYEIISRQHECPSTINIHEYIGYQTLFSGSSRRWLQILVELGSSNVNFSTEATTMLLSRMVLQLGPSKGGDACGIVHSVLLNETFAKKLLDQLDQRLVGIQLNWRETNCMESIITMALRVLEISGSSLAKDTLGLLKKARTAVCGWMSVLRNEIRMATDVKATKRYSAYALWAALLCRRTFSYLGKILHKKWKPSSLQCFLECGISLQDNLVEDPRTLPTMLRNALIRDFKLVQRFEAILCESIKAAPQVVVAAIAAIWPGAISSKSAETKIEFLPREKSSWISLTMGKTNETLPQVINFNFLQGHLLVGHKPVGKLPAEYTKEIVLEKLFGNQNLLTFPSCLPGMTFQLAIEINGHQIHLGFLDDELVIRARTETTTLELIPPEVFKTTTPFDLPSSLLDKHVHWLDFQKEIIEIRPEPHIWKKKAGNWCLNLRLRQACRRKQYLINPRSQLFSTVSKIFEGFEIQGEIMIVQSDKPPKITRFDYQPPLVPLLVKLPRLQLSFVVGSNGFLFSEELRSEIDPNQDVGTLYGLESVVALRSPLNHRQRSILVPMGMVKYKRKGPHVTIKVENDGDYARFFINDLLGRLECPAEPRLLYLKAQLHAYTSFVIPDPLTGRTGTEEAIHVLKSGYCQPWTPITIGPNRSLMLLAKLTPRRVYYPAELKNLQRVFWDEHLTTNIQSDAFRPIVESILQISEDLSIFARQNTELPPLEPAGESHLNLRSRARRAIFERPNAGSSDVQIPLDNTYESRDRSRSKTARKAMIQSLIVIRNWPTKIFTTEDLAGIIQIWSSFGGFHTLFERVLISDILDVDLKTDFGSLVNLCRSFTWSDRYRFMFLIATLAFGHEDSTDLILVRTLVAFGVLGDLKKLEPPKWDQYIDFQANKNPTIEDVLKLAQPYLTPYAGDDRSITEFKLAPKQIKKLQSEQQVFEKQRDNDANLFATFLLKQWPCIVPTVHGFSSDVLLDVEQAMEPIRSEWLRLYQNLELSDYLSQVQFVLAQHQVHDEWRVQVSEVVEREVLQERVRGGEFPTLQDLFRRATAEEFLTDISIVSKITDTIPSHQRAQINHKTTMPLSELVNGSRNRALQHPHSSPPSAEISELESIIRKFTQSTNTVRNQYGADLKQSLSALKQITAVFETQHLPIDRAILIRDIIKARQEVQTRLSLLLGKLEGVGSNHWLDKGGLWPSITKISLLENLRSVSSCKFGSGMKKLLVDFGLAIATLQRLLRMEDAHVKFQKQRLFEEQDNVGHANWTAFSNPDWLLLEIDTNMLIRPGQIDVAMAIISPPSKFNSVLQMNMGQGKTSCIIPMAAAALADGSNIVRVIVPKPLLLQTAQLLHARLGGLLGRKVSHVPFSRKTATEASILDKFRVIHQIIRDASGVMLALPEHQLSFKLSGLQQLSDGNISKAREMIKTQKWLSRVSRDLIDESDSILALRTQLIYPSGSQKTVDGHPHRWVITETLLAQVDGHLWSLAKDYPQSIEVVRRPQGGFPVVYFLRKDAEDALLSRLVDDIYRGRSPIIPSDCLPSDRQVIVEYISVTKISPEVEELVRHLFVDKPAAKQAVFLLRGLLVHRILLMTLKKRWNVQYGLHPSRDPIAVPYMAKGTPSEQAEWGHPDVAILFTCLAFYYEGLTIAQIRQSLEHVLKSDDPSQVYDGFVQNSNIPGALRDWASINVDDEGQLIEIWRHIRYKTIVIDYFLNTFVFPRHAKQFQMKLQASGWDIPLFDSDGRGDKSSRFSSISHVKNALTSGFSGTNDWKRMLPLTISQDDLPGLSHTNAEVLTYLLQPRNRDYVLAAGDGGKHLSELELLSKISGLNIKVLIDAGAQILEMTNEGLVRAWLKIFPDAKAAVFFNEDERPWVVYQNGKLTPLLATPFADDLSECLVYLDEAHTRGTDLKMPYRARGALTLGPNQSKDHTVQAAMRLRQLSTTQSITFFAPPEVHQSILDLQNRTSSDKLDSFDVVCWLLEQTCSGIEQLQPLFFSQGADFCRRAQAGLLNPDFLVDPVQRESYLGSVRLVEQQTLEKLYGTSAKAKATKSLTSASPKISEFIKELHTRRKGFQDSGNAVHGSALQEVEQEREVAYEVEAVREVQKPVRYTPLKFSGLHRDILSFAKTGNLAADHNGYEDVLETMGRTLLGRKYRVTSTTTPSRLYVSSEFSKTVKLQGQMYDNLQRHVTWILWSGAAESALVITPEEAELLIPLLDAAKQSPTYLLTYTPPATRKMLHFNDLKYFAVPELPADWEAPSWLKIKLGIFAGRLYFDYCEYKELLLYLGVEEATALIELDAEDTPSISHSSDTDLPKEAHGKKKSRTTAFTRRPLAFLQEWLALRRKGQDFSQTPMGFVCQGKPLLESHPFFTKVGSDSMKDLKPVQPETTGFSKEDEEQEDGDSDSDQEDFGGDRAYGGRESDSSGKDA